MKVAAIQMVTGIAVDANLAQAHRLLDQAAQGGAELAVLPEYFGFMGRQDRDKLVLAETPGLGPMQAFLADTARELGLWIVGGTLPMAVPDAPPEAPAITNTCLLYSPRGDCRARYDKMHLFRFDNGQERYDESTVLRAGDAPVVADITDRNGQPWRLGLSVCYDLRFPELYRQLRADLIAVPSAFTHTTGQAHWEVLLRARAIENQAYVLAAAQGGAHENGRLTWGRSLVVDPWGTVLAQQATGPAVVLADLSREDVQRVRRQLPALEHRRL